MGSGGGVHGVSPELLTCSQRLFLHKVREHVKKNKGVFCRGIVLTRNTAGVLKVSFQEPREVGHSL